MYTVAQGMANVMADSIKAIYSAWTLKPLPEPAGNPQVAQATAAASASAEATRKN